jgi:hypothetical protein
MTENPQILFNKTLEQLRQLGAWGGRTYGRNQRLRRALIQEIPHIARSRTALRAETAAEAIHALDARFPWLAGAEKQLSQNQNAPARRQPGLRRKHLAK